MKDSEPYQLSFTAGGLLVGESRIVLQAYDETRNWDDAKSILLSENRLSERIESTASRKIHEIRLRFEPRPDFVIAYMVEADDEKFRLASWYCVCAAYRLAAEFAIEVVREKVSVYDFHLTSEDYDSFFNSRADWHEELDGLTSSTAKKIKTVMFRMLREAGLMTNRNRLYSIRLDQTFVNLIAEDRPDLLPVFPDETIGKVQRYG